MNKPIGEEIARRRKAAGLSQNDLAQRVGLTPQAIWLIETGKSEDPLSSTLISICGVFGCTVEQLVANGNKQKG